MSTTPEKIKKAVFDTEDRVNVKHTRIGVWDLYEERDPTISKIPGASRAESYWEMAQSLHFVWRMIKDIGSLPGVWSLLSIYLLLNILGSLVPAVSLW